MSKGVNLFPQINFLVAGIIVVTIIVKWFLPSALYQGLLPAVLTIMPLFYIFRRSLIGDPLYFLLVFFHILLALNPRMATWYHGIFGVLLHLNFPTFMVYYLKKANKNPVKFNFLIIIGSVEILIGISQYILGSSHWLNFGSTTEALIGDGFRVSGTFNYLAGYSAFLIFYTFIIISDFIKNGALIRTFLLLTLTLLGVLVNGSRSVMIIFVYILIAFFPFRRLIVRVENLFYLLPVIYLAGQLPVLKRGFINFADRVEITNSSGESLRRIYGYFSDFGSLDNWDLIFGYGIGSTHIPLNSLFGVSDYILNYGFFEEEIERYVLEGGIILLFVKIVTLFWVSSYFPFKRKRLVFLMIIMSIVMVFTFNILLQFFTFLGILIYVNTLKKGTDSSALTATHSHTS